MSNLLKDVIDDQPHIPKDILAEKIRGQILEHSKNFKTSWVNLGQALFGVWQDKLYQNWGYEKFEHYVEEEVGLKKQLAIKLLKTYYFIEQEEPAYLKEEFKETRLAVNVPNYEAMNLLRLAKRRKELLRQDYEQIRKEVLDKGKDVSLVRKDLTALIRERKAVDSNEERNKRNDSSIKKLITALDSFIKDMDTLKLIPQKIIQESEQLKEDLKIHVE